jgi:hypothetical protein
VAFCCNAIVAFSLLSLDRSLHGKRHALTERKWRCSCKAGMSNFKQVVIYILVSKLPVIYHPLLLLYLALSKNIGKNNTAPGKFVVRALILLLLALRSSSNSIFFNARKSEKSPLTSNNTPHLSVQRPGIHS